MNKDLLIHPGLSILEWLENNQMPPLDLSLLLEVSEFDILQVTNGEKDITNELAQKLDNALSIPSSFWINLQNNYDLEVSKFKL